MKNNKNKNKIFILIAALALCAAFILSGCAEVRLAAPLGDDILLKVDREMCSTGEAVFRLMEVKNFYKPDADEDFWFRAIGNSTFEEYIKDSVKEEMIKMTSSILMAEEMGVYLTDEDKTAYQDKARQAYNTISGIYNVSAYNITPEAVTELYRKKAIYEKVYNTLSDGLTMEISEADTKVITVNYAQIPQGEDINKVEELRDRINNGDSFEKACNDFGCECVLNRVLKKGEMPTAFDNVAYALMDGELSEIVETKDGMFVIQCVEDYMVSESVANHNKVISDTRRQKFDEEYVKFSQTALLNFNNSFWDKIKVSEL